MTNYDIQNISAEFYTQFEAYCNLSDIHTSLSGNFSEIYSYTISMSNDGVTYGDDLPYTIIDNRHQYLEVQPNTLIYKLQVCL